MELTLEIPEPWADPTLLDSSGVARSTRGMLLDRPLAWGRLQLTPLSGGGIGQGSRMLAFLLSTFGGPRFRKAGSPLRLDLSLFELSLEL